MGTSEEIELLQKQVAELGGKIAECSHLLCKAELTHFLKEVLRLRKRLEELDVLNRRLSQTVALA